MKKYFIIILSILIVSCSNYKDKKVSEKLTDNELKESIKENDSTILLFHSKLNDYRTEINNNDIDRLNYSEITYGDVKKYLFKKYSDTIFRDEVDKYYNNNKDNYYNESYKRVEDKINLILDNNKKSYSKKISIKYLGLNPNGYFKFSLNHVNKINRYVDFDFFTVVNGRMIELNFNSISSLSSSKTIYSKNTFYYYLPRNISKSDSENIRTQLNNLNEEDYVIYTDDYNLVNDSSYSDEIFHGVLSKEYSFRLLNYEKLEKEKYISDTTKVIGKDYYYSYLSEEELNVDIMSEYKLREFYLNSLLNENPVFNSIYKLLNQINFYDDYEDYYFRVYIENLKKKLENNKSISTKI